MKSNRSMAPGSFIPELAYDDVRAAATWLCTAFGFKERLRIFNHRVQLTFGDGSMVAIERAAEAPVTVAHRVMVRVDNARAHHARAAAAGAKILSPPSDQPFGERQYSAQDVGGHHWVFSETIADVNPSDWGGELVD